MRLAVNSSKRLNIISAGRASSEVHRVSHPESVGNFPQFLAGGRKDSAQQSIVAKLLHPGLPALSATAQPLEDSGQLRRDRSLAFAKNPSGVVDQLDIATK